VGASSSSLELLMVPCFLSSLSLNSFELSFSYVRSLLEAHVSSRQRFGAQQINASQSDLTCSVRICCGCLLEVVFSISLEHLGSFPEPLRTRCWPPRKSSGALWDFVGGFWRCLLSTRPIDRDVLAIRTLSRVVFALVFRS